MPLLYWHGLNPFGALELNEAGSAWAGRGFQVVGFAALGIADDETFNLSAYRPSRLAELIVETADELELEHFAFVGWSWGASIGVHLAVRYGGLVAALVLLDAGHTDLPGDSERSLEVVLGELSSQQERYRFESWEAFLVKLGQAQIPVLLVLAAQNDTIDETERFRRAVPQAEVALVGDWLLSARPYFAA